MPRMVLRRNQKRFQDHRENNKAFPPLCHRIRSQNCRHVGSNLLLRMYFVNIRCKPHAPPMSPRCHVCTYSTRNRSDGMTFECKQAYGEQKGLRFFNFPVHDSSNFLPDLSRKGKSCTKNGFRVYILYFEPYAARRNNRA